jgi:hypothetical protein
MGDVASASQGERRPSRILRETSAGEKKSMNVGNREELEVRLRCRERVYVWNVSMVFAKATGFMPPPLR